MLDVHPPHSPTHTWKDFFIHIATIVVGLLIAVGLEQTVEAIHHHHQREQLDSDLIEESRNNLKTIDHDLKYQAFESRYDAVAVAVSTTGKDTVRVSLPPLPCLPGSFSDSTIRLVLPYENAWITARENGIANLLPAPQVRIYFRRSVLFDLIRRTTDQMYDACPRLNAMQRRLARRSADGDTYDWALTPAQAEELATLTSHQAAMIKALCYRLRNLRAFEEDLLDGGHRIIGASLEKPLTDMVDPEDLPPSH